MATNPNVIQTSDPAQMFLAAQKQNQDLVKNVLETMRLQQQVDDVKQQNQWQNTWNVLMEQSKNVAGGMAGLIGQNQGLIKQLFISNGMNQHQAGLSVGNLAKTLLTGDAQAEIRFAKYVSDPSAMYMEEVPDPIVQEPAQETPPQPVVEQKQEATVVAPVQPTPPKPTPTPAPQATGKYDILSRTEAAQSSPFGYDNTQYGLLGGKWKSAIRNTNLAAQFIEQAKNDAANNDGKFTKEVEEIQTVLGEGFPGAKIEAGPNGTGPNAKLQEALSELDTAYKAFADDPKTAAQDREAGLAKFREMARKNPNGTMAIMKILVAHGYVDPKGSNYGRMKSEWQSANTVGGKVKPGFAYTGDISKFSPGMEILSPSQQREAAKAQDDKRLGVAAPVPAAPTQPSTRIQDTKLAASKEVATTISRGNPTVASAEVAEKGAAVAPLQALVTAANNPQTPQGQKAISLIEKKGTELVMHIDAIQAALANGEAPPGESTKAYKNYLSNKSKEAKDWLSQFGPITEEWLTKVYGRPSVADAFQDFVAHGTGGAQGLAEKRNQELQGKQLEDAMSRFATQFGLDKEKFTWQKSVDIATAALQMKELEIRAAGVGSSSENLALKTILDTVDKYDAMFLKEADPKKRANLRLKTFEGDPNYRSAWSTYVDWSASQIGLPPGTYSYTSGWFEGLLRGIFGGKTGTMPTLPGGGTPETQASGVEGAPSKAADDFVKGIK